jgi:hypothetical protein
MLVRFGSALSFARLAIRAAAKIPRSQHVCRAIRAQLFNDLMLLRAEQVSFLEARGNATLPPAAPYTEAPQPLPVNRALVEDILSFASLFQEPTTLEYGGLTHASSLEEEEDEGPTERRKPESLVNYSSTPVLVLVPADRLKQEIQAYTSRMGLEGTRFIWTNFAKKMKLGASRELLYGLKRFWVDNHPHFAADMIHRKAIPTPLEVQKADIDLW